MYSEDLYATHTGDHSMLFIYATLFAMVAMGVLLRMTFHSTNNEYSPD
jgi:hypothetical protein